MTKKILFFLSLCLFFASIAYAGNLHNSSDIGHDEDSYGSYVLQIWGGGSDCTATLSSGAHNTGLQCPGFMRWEQYDPSCTTLVTYYSWYSPVSGKWKISSGSAGDSWTGYGIPTDIAFNMESSGADM